MLVFRATSMIRKIQQNPGGCFMYYIWKIAKFPLLKLAFKIGDQNLFSPLFSSTIIIFLVGPDEKFVGWLNAIKHATTLPLVIFFFFFEKNYKPRSLLYRVLSKKSFTKVLEKDCRHNFYIIFFNYWCLNKKIYICHPKR